MAGAETGVLVRQALEAIWNQGALEVADALFAPDYVNHGGLIPDLVRGPEAIKFSVALYRTAFPDLHLIIEDVSADGETILLRWTARTAPPGAAAGSAPSGQVGMVTGSTRSRLVGGQIVESWTGWDQAGTLQWLGLIPSLEGGEAETTIHRRALHGALDSSG